MLEFIKRYLGKKVTLDFGNSTVEVKVIGCNINRENSLLVEWPRRGSIWVRPDKILMSGVLKGVRE